MLPQTTGAPSRIIVADDDELLSAVLSQSLDRLGYLVIIAPAGVLTEELAVDADLVVLDANIPGTDFASTLRSIRGAKIPVLVLTGEPAPPDGVDESEYLGKPVELDSLVAAIARLLLKSSEE